MDEKTINLWRQIEGARRVGKRKFASPVTFAVRSDHDQPGLKNLK